MANGNGNSMFDDPLGYTFDRNAAEAEASALEDAYDHLEYKLGKLEGMLELNRKIKDVEIDLANLEKEGE